MKTIEHLCLKPPLSEYWFQMFKWMSSSFLQGPHRWPSPLLSVLQRLSRKYTLTLWKHRFDLWPVSVCDAQDSPSICWGSWHSAGQMPSAGPDSEDTDLQLQTRVPNQNGKLPVLLVVWSSRKLLLMRRTPLQMCANVNSLCVGIPYEGAARVSEGWVLLPEVVSDAAALTSGRGASSSCREKRKRFQREKPWTDALRSKLPRICLISSCVLTHAWKHLSGHLSCLSVVQ